MKNYCHALDVLINCQKKFIDYRYIRLRNIAGGLLDSLVVWIFGEHGSNLPIAQWLEHSELLWSHEFESRKLQDRNFGGCFNMPGIHWMPGNSISLLPRGRKAFAGIARSTAGKILGFPGCRSLVQIPPIVVGHFTKYWIHERMPAGGFRFRAGGEKGF